MSAGKALCEEHTRLIERVGIMETRADGQGREIGDLKGGQADLRSEIRRTNAILTKSQMIQSRMMGIQGILTIFVLGGVGALVRAFIQLGLFD